MEQVGQRPTPRLPRKSPQLKAFADNTSAKILVTGSSALRIADGRDSLAGRMSMIELGPLRLSEIGGIAGLQLEPFEKDGDLRNWATPEFWLGLIQHASRQGKALTTAFARFSAIGGYPRVHRSPDDDPRVMGSEILETVVERTIQHDAVRPGRASLDQQLLGEVFRRVCKYAGQAVATRNLVSQIQAVLPRARPKEVEECIAFLSDSLLIKRIPPLEIFARRQSNAPKLCLCDHFVRDRFLQESVPLAPEELRTRAPQVSTLAGHLIESTLGYYLAGIPGIDLSWFPERQDEPEVDYIVTLGSKRIPIEIKYKRGSLRPPDWRGVKSFAGHEAYGASFGVVVTQDEAGLMGNGIIAVPASSFLLLR